jgi:hypothetical protein
MYTCCNSMAIAAVIMQKRKSIKLFFFIVIINMYLEDKNKTT